ncbi:MAG TPA: PhoX family phosphatase [Burkholderiaceae bacterium]|nr:PhoX family phosphatase [Burkholderiaceae bacterium]
MSYDDEITNSSTNPHINELIESRLQDPARRGLLRGGLGAAALSFIGGTSLLAGCGGSDDAIASAAPAPAPDADAARAPARGNTKAPAPSRPTELRFTAVAKSLADSLVVPAGYTASVLLRLGDPIAAGVSDYANDGTDEASSYAERAGDHHDGMHFFPIGATGRQENAASARGLLVQNHEAITPAFLHVNGPTISGTGAGAARTSAAEVLKEFYVHGVSIVEVSRAADGSWSYRKNSPFNRRIHTLTEMELSGPAAGSTYMETKYSPDGTRTRGTVNNCANGYTPWGTYLTCEENWAGYFRRITSEDDKKRSTKELTSLTRYGVRGNGRELWATVTPDTADELYGRWNAMVLGGDAGKDYRNGPNTYGWNVEIDPFAPRSTPKKRTAMGRFAHEGAWPARVEAGKPLVWYMGCDSRNEYIYKYVSNASWDPVDASRGLAAGDKYLDDGKLYVAKFNADGSGNWIELSFGANGITAANTAYSFADQADVLINTRLAADVVGATKMDRPEWGAVDPVTGAVYMTLTNNNATLRTLAATDAANPRHYNDKRSDGTDQRGNPNGHIIRWLEDAGDPAATKFKWDIFLFGARESADPANVNISGLTADNDFSSPDGLWFSKATNVCWIQTDDGAYTDKTNCMLLAALPGEVSDGGVKTITNTDVNNNEKQVQTYVGAKLGTKLRRFLVGPVECEITGLAESPDGRALFVNIQHPGEDTRATDIGTPALFTSHWPDGGNSRPRSATIVITRNDGGVIGV